MSIHAALTHKTSYHYDRLTRMGPQVIRLRPAPHARTPIVSYSLKVEPADHWINWQQDPFGNYLARVIFPEKVDHFCVTVDLIADMASINPFDFFVEDSAKTFPFSYEPELKKDLAPYLATGKPGPLLEQKLAQVARELKPGTNSIDFLVQLNQGLEREIDYLIRMEPGVQSPEQTLELCSGSCRDSGWLLVHILRHLGLAARFVSGYLVQLAPDVKALDGPSGTDHDFTDLHAWAEVYLPGAGWVGLDPTSGLLAGEGHIPVAATPHPVTAAPISGGLEEAEVSFDFDMQVRRIYELPRVTKPYTDSQWQQIDKMGARVDERLQAGDVRLTMGGEPTFVSIDEFEADEWNTAAVGPTKRHFAETLVRCLKDRFAPGGLLHYGQGKWYPGEQLPRWTYSLYWRKDEEALWQNPALIDTATARKPVDHNTAQRFARQLTERLEIDSECVQPAYEDLAHFMLEEQKLPVNVEPGDNRLEDEQARRRMMKVFDRGLGTPAGYVLPVQVWHSKERGRVWVSEVWNFRRRHLFLMPGDSPLGFRLPLGSLPWLSPEQTPRILPQDPFAAARQPLPARAALLQNRRSVRLESRPPAPVEAGPQNEMTGSIRTALSIEPRDGHLCVFMPPLVDAEDYAALAAAIEDTAAALDQPVHIEGYEPPKDPRLNVIKVTPDPGVIEVNIHPAADWAESKAITGVLYEEARLARLGTEKFMLDGSHTGTGGGNHIVLGAATPADSPFLRRPDLLGSLITWWQRHPSLSYLFSGLFIGPTSQAPRVDEARTDSLYELEIALAQLPGPDQADIPPWLVDRLFRNLLVDLTGNTHRTELCIDKLYSPDSSSGRLGLVEFRSFEMPPHPQMSLVQQLLLRAIIARLWQAPYRHNFIRWGTLLHDKFMLPHYVRTDFLDMLADLRRHGFDFDPAWFDPHFEFRFPLYGSVHYDGVTIELRRALEPWHVLGEEGTNSGTARYVDSSLERVQVKTIGLDPDRHQLACNQVQVPLQPTARPDEAVAGVRYRAWQPPSCLHPVIGVHAPLTFDLVDRWHGRSLGGCRYHVAHPGGRGYDIFPVNAYEAEGRRLSRFEAMGHTAGQMRVQTMEPNPDFPHTLDLRRTPPVS